MAPSNSPPHHASPQMHNCLCLVSSRGVYHFLRFRLLYWPGTLMGLRKFMIDLSIFFLVIMLRASLFQAIYTLSKSGINCVTIRFLFVFKLQYVTVMWLWLIFLYLLCLEMVNIHVFVASYHSFFFQNLQSLHFKLFSVILTFCLLGSN